MRPTASLDVLIAQIQIQLEQLGNLVVTSPLRQGNAERVAAGIVDGLRARGIAASLCLPVAPGASVAGVHSNRTEGSSTQLGSETSSRTFTPEQAGTPQLAKLLLASPGTVTVAVAPGVLEDPTALFLAAAADAVLLVAETGRTTRDNLRRARLELETAGARLVGAVLVE